MNTPNTWNATPTCTECGRVFDLWSDTDADEYYNGHDCEVRA